MYKKPFRQCCWNSRKIEYIYIVIVQYIRLISYSYFMVQLKLLQNASMKSKYKTRIEPVGEPYREVCLSPWKGNWRISKNRIDWRNVLLSEEK